jgi:hypothetical protein
MWGRSGSAESMPTLGLESSNHFVISKLNSDSFFLVLFSHLLPHMNCDMTSVTDQSGP